MYVWAEHAPMWACPREGRARNWTQSYSPETILLGCVPRHLVVCWKAGMATAGDRVQVAVAGCSFPGRAAFTCHAHRGPARASRGYRQSGTSNRVRVKSSSVGV